MTRRFKQHALIGWISQTIGATLKFFRFPQALLRRPHGASSYAF